MGLFKPWMSKNSARADKAVGKLRDQKKLTEVALKAPLFTTRIEAITRLTDQEMIAKIAAADNSDYVRMVAVSACKDEALLARLACKINDTQLACKAVERISGEHMLVMVAESAENPNARMAAAKRIGNEALLMKIAANILEHGAWILDRIVQFPDAEEQLKILMMSAKGQEVRDRARSRLGEITSDPNTLLACARQDDWLYSKIIEKIDDLALLEKTMQEDADETCRRMIANHAMKRLSDSSLLSFALRADNGRYIRGKVAVELMKRDASRYGEPLAPLLDECLRDDRVYFLSELGDPRAIAPLEALALSERGYKAPHALGCIRTKAAVEALLRIMEQNHSAASYAQKALMKMYHEAKGDTVHDAIAAIPRRVYHEHDDIGGDRSRSCHDDEPYVHFDLAV